MSFLECEGLARYELERLEMSAPIDPWEVVAGYEGVQVVWGGPGQRPHLQTHGDGTYTIVLDPSERPTRVALALLHELAHILLDLHNIQNDEKHAWWLAGALLLPREAMLRALARGDTVETIARDNPCASHEAVARRLVAMSSSSVLWVHDVAPQPRRPYKVVSPGWRWQTRRPTPLEQEAMQCALEERCTVEIVGGVRAWTVADDPWLRVLCLSDAEVLMRQLA